MLRTLIRETQRIGRDEERGEQEKVVWGAVQCQNVFLIRVDLKHVVTPLVRFKKVLSGGLPYASSCQTSTRVS